MIKEQRHTDIETKGWIRVMPKRIRPYLLMMRLDRPIGTWLLLLPALWIILMTGDLSHWPILLLFTIGAIVMRGAGCVINDLWDRNLDGGVERTSIRPIPSGQINIWQALMLLLGLLMLGLVILLQFNRLTILVGLASLVFIAIYPLMKRWTWWPQAFLGLTFNFGALMGYTAIKNDIGLSSVILYCAGFFWTLGYDTIYALQDRDDDQMLGIKSTARLFIEKWDNVYIPLYFFYIMHFIFLMLSLHYSHSGVPILGWFIFVIPALHLIWQIKTLTLNDPQNALKRFKSNRDYGLLVCTAIIITVYIL